MKKLLAIIIFFSLTATALADFILDPQTMTVRDRRRSDAPQSAWMLGKAQDIGIAYNAPVLLRIFKYEEIIEIWRQKPDGEYIYMTNIAICKQGKQLGPKQREGDFQTPEGFYEITKESLNPDSRLWLAIRVEYPNAYDRAHKHGGGDVEIHGGCRSAGCIAIEDGPITDLYALVRDALNAGQDKIQLQIYPFKMRGYALDDPKHNDFWSQLRVGYEKFEETRRPIVYRIENGRYVID
jgi:murein L,D-transpeptidase YafK